MGSTRRAVTLENCLNFVELRKDLERIAFVAVPAESDWNVLTARKKKSALNFFAEIYNDIIRVPSNKAYAQVFMSYDAPLKPLPSLERVHALHPSLNDLAAEIPHVQFDKIIGARSTRTNKEHVIGYQLGITFKTHAEEELRNAICETLRYFGNYTEGQAKAIKK